MSEAVAIVGSRHGADLEAVKGFVHALYAKQPDTLLVSGGADGVDRTAEQLWLELGGRVKSFRVREQAIDKFAIECWDLGGEQPRVYVMADEPTFIDRTSALFGRDSTIVEHSDRVVAFFRRGRSGGTQLTVDFGVGAGRHVYEYEAA